MVVDAVRESTRQKIDSPVVVERSLGILQRSTRGAIYILLYRVVSRKSSKKWLWMRVFRPVCGQKMRIRNYLIAICMPIWYNIHHMKRTALYLKTEQIKKLQRISDETGAPIAELVRRAIDLYLKQWRTR